MTLFSLYRTRRYLPGFLALGVCCFVRCMVSLEGGTSTTDNPKVIGTIIDDDFKPASNTRVVLIPENYDPLRGASDTVAGMTDKDGRFALPAAHEGLFNIQAVHLVKRTRLLIRGIAVATGDDSVRVPDDTLKRPGSISVQLPGSADRANGYFYIPGTTVFTLLAGAGTRATLDSVPAATVSAVCYTTRSTVTPTVLQSDVTVFPGATTVLAMVDWKYSTKLFLNTSPSGAGVAGNVTDFPVLVRLSSGNFRFNEAQPHGEDIRFVKSDNSALAYQIERWDVAGQRAEIWVKVDTVRGNDGAQSIMMYWGNPSANPESSGAGVFDSLNGFAGVWHLGETSGTRAADASPSGFSGIYRGGLPNNASGPFSICQNITRPGGDYVDMGNVLNPGMKNISIGVWLKRSSVDNKPQALIAKTNGEGPSAAYGFLLSIDDSNAVRFYLGTGGSTWGDDGAFDLVSAIPIVDTTTWHYVFVAVDRADNSRCKMYVDGVDRTGVFEGNVAAVTDVSNALNLHIGTESDNDHSYCGAIGEATIAFTTRSADWVKLSYMNQKTVDGLVVFGKE